MWAYFTHSKSYQAWSSRPWAALALFTWSAWASAEVWIVTDSSQSVDLPSGAQSVVLDQPTLVERSLSAGLPDDPVRAAQLAQQRLTSGVARQLTEAHQGVADAWSLGVMKVPAVVVDRRYVIYGETNVPRALDRIAEYRRTHP
jgi:integrating conjugative element protein (TIGR03757 family)